MSQGNVPRPWKALRRAGGWIHIVRRSDDKFLGKVKKLSDGTYQGDRNNNYGLLRTAGWSLYRAAQRG